MTEQDGSQGRLSRSFHQTFIPERQYISALLKFAAKGGQGDIQVISECTGIPTGQYSGKVSPILDYCRGMGLISLSSNGGKPRTIKCPVLTPFGRVVLLEDPFLKEPVTQWIAHFQLCSPLTGADVWNKTFFEGLHILGMEFKRDRLEEYLAMSYNVSPGRLIGPLVRMYEDESSFSACGALSEKNGIVRRSPAPISDEFAYGYGAWLIHLIEVHFPGLNQITVTELEKVSGWRSIPGWSALDSQRALDYIEKKGLISVDRHMSPWLIRRSEDSSQAWAMIYNDLI